MIRAVEFHAPGAPFPSHRFRLVSGFTGQRAEEPRVVAPFVSYLAGSELFCHCAAGTWELMAPPFPSHVVEATSHRFAVCHAGARALPPEHAVGLLRALWPRAPHPCRSLLADIRRVHAPCATLEDVAALGRALGCTQA